MDKIVAGVVHNTQPQQKKVVTIKVVIYIPTVHLFLLWFSIILCTTPACFSTFYLSTIIPTLDFKIF